jgi:hypothetical protein
LVRRCSFGARVTKPRLFENRITVKYPDNEYCYNIRKTNTSSRPAPSTLSAAFGVMARSSRSCRHAPGLDRQGRPARAALVRRRSARARVFAALRQLRDRSNSPIYPLSVPDRRSRPRQRFLIRSIL